MLDKYGITPTLALDKTMADHYPTLVKEGQKRSAEFIAHGLSRRRIIHTGMSKDEERDYIRASIDAVERATGARPVGWSGPDFQETPNTPNLLAGEGIRYVCDWGNDEQPYKMTPKTGELYSLGVNAYLDDNYIHLHGRRTFNEVAVAAYIRELRLVTGPHALGTTHRAYRHRSTVRHLPIPMLQIDDDRQGDLGALPPSQKRASDNR